MMNFMMPWKIMKRKMIKRKMMNLKMPEKHNHVHTPSTTPLSNIPQGSPPTFENSISTFFNDPNTWFWNVRLQYSRRSVVWGMSKHQSFTCPCTLRSTNVAGRALSRLYSAVLVSVNWLTRASFRTNVSHSSVISMTPVSKLC